MMTKELLENLLIEFDEMGFEPTTLCDSQKEVESFRNRLKQVLDYLKSNPSEALKNLDKVIDYLNNVYDYKEIKEEIRKDINTIKQALLKAQEQEELLKSGDLSDGYHTFNQLYYQRCILFASLVRLNKDKSWKSFKHSDGKYCFDSNGEWFIVGIDTPIGSYTYHYEKKYWDLFECQELECGKEWDGHTEEDVTRLLSLSNEQEKVLEILKEKRVDLSYLRCCIEDNQSVERYNEYIRNKTMDYDHEEELTEEEFKFLKRYLK